VALDRGFRDLDRARDDEYWQPWHDDQRLADLLGLVDTEGLTREQGWRADLRLLAREIKRRAYAPFALVPEEEFDRGVAQLDHDIPGLADAQILVGMMKLVRHLDDGHAGVRPPQEQNKDLSRLLPVDLFLFPEGLFVIGAGPGHDDLLGAKIEKIGRRTVAEAIAALDPVIVRDNEQQVTFMVPRFLRYTAVLQGLGIIDDLRKASLTVRGADGTSREVTLDAEPGEHMWDRYPPGWTALADTVPGHPRSSIWRCASLMTWPTSRPNAASHGWAQRPERIFATSSDRAVRSGGPAWVALAGTADRPDGPHR